MAEEACDSSLASELAFKLAMLLQNNNQPLNPKLSDNLQIDLKLNSQNYALWSRMIRWKSKKQKVASLSSVEPEFRGIARGLVEALWLRKLVFEISFAPRESIQIISDNETAIQISEYPVQHNRTKHVEVDRYFIKEKLEDEIIKLPFVKSEDQIADMLTKAVRTSMFHKCLSKLNFGNLNIQLEREC